MALAEGVVERNPATTLFTPRNCRASKPKRVLEPIQVLALCEALRLREKLAARLAACEGMRPGEILALRREDIGDSYLWVRRRLYKANVDTPKTERSVRQVALTTGTAQLLTEWLNLLPYKEPDAWLFPSESGKPVSRDNLWRRYMLPKLKVIGLEWATFQVMRRTFATLSKKAGVDPHTRSAQMGNTVDVNENEYAVAGFEDKLAAVRRLELVVSDGAGILAEGLRN
jgi:integrase